MAEFVICCWQQSVKQASRAQILDKATDYIQYMRRKNHTHQQDIDDLKKQNAMLEQQGECGLKAQGQLQVQEGESWCVLVMGTTDQNHTCTTYTLLLMAFIALSQWTMFHGGEGRDLYLSYCSVFLWLILVRALEKAKGNTTLQANYSSSDSSWYTNTKGSTVSAFDGGSDSSSESETEEPANRKKLRVEPI